MVCRPPAGRRAMLLPGAGSDQVFVAAAFAAPLAAVGVALASPCPGLSYWRALDTALHTALTERTPLLVGGVSLGAQVALEWAAQLSKQATQVLDGLLLALPAWTDLPDAAPAAQSAAASARALRAYGLDATLAAARAGVPAWLADELARAWTAHGPALADTLAAAASRPGPGLSALRGVRVPTAVVGLSDDPLHPHAVARHWASALPRAELVTTTLVAVGGDRECLGRAAMLGWLRARVRRAPGLA